MICKGNAKTLMFKRYQLIHETSKSRIFGRKISIPIISAENAEIKTAAAARSFIFLM